MKAELTWHTEKRLIKELIPLERNPFGKINREKKKRLENKIKRLGVFEIPTIDLNNELLTFNKRCHILMALGRGDESIDVRVPDRALTADERKEVILASNIHEGEWDGLILEEDFSDLNLEEVGLDLKELDIEVKEVAPADEPLPPSIESVKTDVAQGDLFEFVGEDVHHRLLCGDSTIADHVARLLDGAKPILMVTDPPYGVKYDPSWRNDADGGNRQRLGKVENDNHSDWRETYSLFPGSIAYVWHASWFTDVVIKNLKDCGFDLLYLIIWNKQQMVFGQGDYHWKHEPCWYAVKKGATHNWQGDRTQTTVWDIKNLVSAQDDDSKQLHGTQKPIDCMANPIKNNTAKGDAVYDPFGGSGTTMVAAHQLKRNCYMMELDEKYVHLIAARMIKLDPSLKVTRNGKEYRPD